MLHNQVCLEAQTLKTKKAQIRSRGSTRRYKGTQHKAKVPSVLCDKDASAQKCIQIKVCAMYFMNGKNS